MSSSVVGSSVKREGSARIRSNKGTPVYECSYSYIVECSAKDESYSSVLATSGLPLVGITVEPSGLAVCTSKVGTRRESNPFYWDIVCEFSSEIDDSSGSGGDPTSDPTTWVPIYETRFERYQEVVTQDFSGTTIANSASQPFPNGITVTRHIPVWEFFQIEASSVTDNQILGRIDVVNSSTFTRGGSSYAAKTLLCNVLSSVIGRYYGTLRRLTQYQVKYKADKWTHKRFDVGNLWQKQSLTTLIPIEEASPIPIPLDGNGRPAGGYDGTSDRPTKTPSAPAILEFDIYDAVSFSFLR